MGASRRDAFRRSDAQAFPLPRHAKSAFLWKPLHDISRMCPLGCAFGGSRLRRSVSQHTHTHTNTYAPHTRAQHTHTDPGPDNLSPRALLQHNLNSASAQVHCSEHCTCFAKPGHCNPLPTPLAPPLPNRVSLATEREGHESRCRDWDSWSLETPRSLCTGCLTSAKQQKPSQKHRSSAL